MAASRTVLVSNVALEATETTLADFFRFCGPLESVTLKAGATDEAQTARVVFEADAGARTALLLSNAVVLGKPIAVVEAVGVAGECVGSGVPGAAGAGANAV